MKGLILMALAWLPLWCAGPPMGGEKQAAGERGVPLETEPMEKADTLAASRGEERQEPFKKIRLHFKVPGQYYDKIEFWDEVSQRLVKKVDLEGIHPFNMLPFKIVGKSYGSNQYDLAGVDINELERHLGALDIPATIPDQVPAGADGQIMVFDGPTMEHFTAAAYNLYLTNRHGQVIAILGEYCVFNDQGEIISTIKTNRGGSSPIVTQDGKYLAVKYGGAYGACGSGGLQEGLLFFETETGGAVLDYQGEESWGNGVSIGEAHNKVLAAVYVGGNEQPNRHWVFDIDRGKMYYIELFEKKVENRPDWTKEGAVFTKHGIRREFLYDKDFQITNLQIENR